MSSSPPAAHVAAQPDWPSITTSVIGGVGLLSFSMSIMSKALRGALGDRLRALISAACGDRVRGCITGMLVTSLLTSATASSLLVVEFVAAGLMTFKQSLGVTCGINIGSTLNAHLVSVNIAAYWLYCVAAGAVVATVWSTPTGRNVGDACIGLGIMFHSVSVISAGIAPLRTYTPFLTLLAGMNNLPLALGVSAVSAVALQSSNTVIAISIALAQQGLLPIDAALYFVLGSNVGTCVSAVISALGKSRETMRVAVAYLLMKAVGVALLLPFLPLFAQVVVNSVGGDVSPASLPRAIANAHTMVNVFIAVVFMPLLDTFASFMLRLVPDVNSPPKLHAQ